MRIFKRSSSSAILLTLAIGGTAPAWPEQTTVPPKTGARASVGAEGAAAMERLRGAIRKKASSSPVKGPSLPPPPNPDRPLARRAFEGLRKRETSSALDARARAALEAGGQRLAADRAAMAARLRQVLGLDAPEMAEITKAAPAPALKAWIPVVFVSSSMPVATLRSYAQQLERVKGVLAFRGMPGGLMKVAPMAKLSAEILRIDPGCSGPNCAMRAVQLIVDPIVFRQHGITRVPALAMIPGDPTQPYCERDDRPGAAPLRADHIVYGDSALAGLLDAYARLGGKEEVRDAQALVAR